MISRVIPTMLALSLAAMPALAQGEADHTTFGTLIMAFGNANGLVVMTDSMASFKTRDNVIKQYPQPAQKLLRYNDRLVCAIAGLGTVGVPADSRLDASLLGIIEAYRDSALRERPQETIEATLSNIAIAIDFYISSVAEIDEQTGTPISQNHTLLFLVGYDLDGRPKIGKLLLELKRNAQADVPRWSAVAIERVVVPVTQLRWERGGMPDVADTVMAHPTWYSPLRAVGYFWGELAKDRGWTMPLSDIESLGTVIMQLSAAKHPEIGNGLQIAKLSSGKITQIKQGVFAPPTRPFALHFFVGVRFREGALLIRGISINFYEDSSFIGNFNPTELIPSRIPQAVALDNGIFVKCQFENVLLYYDGGKVFFDNTTTLKNVDVLLGPNAYEKHPDVAKWLWLAARKSRGIAGPN